MKTATLATHGFLIGTSNRRKVELQEWRPKDVLLTSEEALDLLKIPGKMLEVQSLPTGETRLKPNAIVGRIVTDHLELLIRPKCPVPSLLLMLAEVYELSKLVPELVGYQTTPEVVDLLVQVFLKQVEYITRVGLKRSYLPQREELSTVRGRVNVQGTLRLHLRGTPRLDCSYEEYTLNVPENRILLTALRAISKNRALPNIRRNLAHFVSAEFADVCEIDVTRQIPEQILCDRLTLHYEPALRMAHLILQSMGIQHEFGSVGVSGFTLDMNQLFERFIASRLRKWSLKKDVVVKIQESHDFDDQKRACIKPDLLFQGVRGGRVVADTKYKLDEAPAPADLYQMLAYCRILKIACGILITAADTAGQCYVVKDGVTTILVVPIDLSRSLAEIESSLEKLSTRIFALLAGEPRIE